jgi:hypothetical protein
VYSIQARTSAVDNAYRTQHNTVEDSTITGTIIRGQTRVLWGNRFFFPCTRHVSMYLRPGIVIHSFIHSFILSFCPTGYYSLLVSSGIIRVSDRK